MIVPLKTKRLMISKFILPIAVVARIPHACSPSASPRASVAVVAIAADWSRRGVSEPSSGQAPSCSPTQHDVDAVDGETPVWCDSCCRTPIADASNSAHRKTNYPREGRPEAADRVG